MRLVSTDWPWMGTAETPATPWWHPTPGITSPTRRCSAPQTATMTNGLSTTAPSSKEAPVGGIQVAAEATSTWTPKVTGHWACRIPQTCKPVACWSNSSSKPEDESLRITLQTQSKCIPLLLYSLAVCNLSKRDLQSLDFTVNRFFMKLFCTKDMSVVTCCQQMFHVKLPSDIIKKKSIKFESKCDS